MQMGAGFKISYMLAFLRSLFSNKSSCRHSLDRGEIKRLEKAMKVWIENRRYRECSLSREDVASELNTSKAFMSAYFADILKSDFYTWRTSLRIEDAKKILLEEADLPSSLVGEMVGINDRSNFHRQFKKVTGLSPKQWRESYGTPK